MTDPELTLAAAYRDVARRRGEATAIRFGDETVSYRELLKRAERFANGLVAAGHRPGDRVAIWLPNRPEWLCAFLGCAMVDCPPVAVNSRYRQQELEHVLSDSGATTLILQPSLGSREYLSMATSVCPALATATPETLGDESDLPLERVFVVGAEADLPSAAGSFEAVLGDKGVDARGTRSDAPCGIFYTSGTTSDPKGVVHDHHSVVTHARVVADWFGVTDDDVGLLVMPVYGLIGFDFAWSVLLSGGALVAHQRFDADRAAETVERRGVTYLFGVGDIFEGILATDRDLTSIERGSAILATADQLRAVEDRCAFPIVQPYGSTELHSHIFVSHPDDPQDERIRPGGPPVDGRIEALVRDPASGEDHPSGGTGELFVRGYVVMDRYLDAPEATEAVIDGGWFRTEDLCELDERGHVRYLSRLGDVLRVRGHLVAPDEIERELLRQGGVEEAVVVGVESSDHQHRPVGFVLASDTTGEALRAALHDRIADYKVPERIVICDEFPTVMGPNGEKIQRSKLVERAERLLD